MTINYRFSNKRQLIILGSSEPAAIFCKQTREMGTSEKFIAVINPYSYI